MDSTPSNTSGSTVGRAKALTVALVAAALCGPDVHAEATAEKLAMKALRNEQVVAFDKFKKAVNSRVDTFRAELKEIEEQLAEGGDGSVAAEAVFQAMVDLQTAVSARLADAMDEQASAAVTALAAFEPVIEGVYPISFYPGDRTDTAGFEDAVDLLLTKAYRRAKKHLFNTAERFAAAGTNVTFRLSPPRRSARIWLSTAADQFPVHQPTIDAVLAWSGADTSADGQIRMSGAADSWSGIADDVIVVASFLLQQPFEIVTPSAGRYTADFDGTAFPEGVWLVGATQNSALPVDVSIGVR